MKGLACVPPIAGGHQGLGAVLGAPLFGPEDGRALGPTLPNALLVRADEVIE